PSMTVPLPSGKPLPSGRTSMSLKATSSGVAGRPNSHELANENGERHPSAVTIRFLGENIANPPLRVHAPRLLGVVVKQGIRTHLVDECLAVRLHVVLLISRAADDLGGLAIPNPVHLKPSLGLGQYRLI